LKWFAIRNYNRLRRYASIVGPGAAGAPPAGAVSIIRATIDDEPALRAALYEAVCWREMPSRPPIEEVLSEPAVAVYLESWGRAGDVGFVAEDASGHGGGAAWYRVFTPDRHGYGFVSQSVPEISIGLEGSWRGRGLGRRLLEHLHAAAIGDSIPRLSLAVNAGNLRAVRLYEHLGYVAHGVGTSLTMEVQLGPETIMTVTRGLQ
jgi:GNAT superfamily N-acetyltransferase